ncbi:hypothetical protein GBAR_LOCUS4740 [Geodia barretti]|uniref:Uncharacterized protein n=1 Tax=Geodia barretti TaxID=519541 RepID=A0AA35R7X9_GEOBA|nr:hypothetical protein GBAR_LOCUS4740 [Geodia barretti]
MSLVFIFNPYFLSFRADILFVLLAVENFLPYVSSPSPSSPSYIPVLASSCLSLLHTLSVVTSPLSLLSTSLEATPISPPPHHSHKTHPQWLQYVDLTHSGIQATSNGITDDAVRIFKNFVSFPYPSWHLLIKFLLRRERIPFLLISMATTHKQIRKGRGPTETSEDSDEIFVDHVFRVLSHCMGEPRLLAETISLLNRSKGTTEDTPEDNFQMVCRAEWLGHAVKETLQRCVAWWVVGVAGELCGSERTSTSETTTDFCSVSTDSSRVTKVSDHILKLLDVLECVLTQLPPPVTFALSHMPPGSSGVETGAKLAEAIGSIIAPWISSPLPSSLPPLLQTQFSFSLSLVSWALNGADTNHRPFPPHICEEIKEGLPLIKKRLQSFGSTLSGSSPDSIPDDKELGHEVVADVLENSPQAQESLRYIYQWLQARKDYIIEMLQQLPGNNQSEYIVPQPPPPSDSLIPQTIGFNPLKVGMSIGSREIGQKQLMEMTLRWKDLLALSLSQLPHDKLVKLVGNRFEFQPGAQLLDNEPQLVQKINNLIRKKSITLACVNN